MPDAEIIDSAPAGALVVTREPEVVLEEARRAARALKDVIDKKAKPVRFNDETYLEFEDWQTVGRFYGIAPRIIRTQPVEFGEVRGFEAVAEAVHVDTGKVVSSAEAMCLNDEEKWRARPKYEWHYVLKGGGTSAADPGSDRIVWEDNPNKPGKKRPKKERVQAGEEHVPLFQLRSMAQTRAGAKALRNALAWVVVLAGYRPTPAEELPGREPDGHDRPDPTAGDVPFDYQPAPAPKPAAAPKAEPKPEPPADSGLAKQYADKILALRGSFKKQPTPQAWDKIVKHWTGKMLPDDQLALATIDQLAAMHAWIGKLADGDAEAAGLVKQILGAGA